MNQVRPDVPSAKWHACVSTVKCDVINEYVSIMVKNNWTSKCTWYKQYKDLVQESRKKVKLDKKIKKKTEMCQGPLCSYVESYRDKLIKEEQDATSYSGAR